MTVGTLCQGTTIAIIALPIPRVGALMPPRTAIHNRGLGGSCSWKGFLSAFPNDVVYCRHEGPVWQVAWAHPMYGNILASCSYDRKVIIWKEENGTWEKTYEYTGHDSSGMEGWSMELGDEGIWVRLK